VYYFLTQQIHRVFIEELRNYWSYHPRYQDIVDHIEGKYSFRERPQYGIVLKNSSGNQVQLAADNFQGHVDSYIYLANVEGKPGLSIEWVKENSVAIQNNGGIFPTAPGIYYVDFCDANGNPTDKAFYLDPLLEVVDETPLKINDTQYQLENGGFLAGTLRLYRMPGNIQLYEGVNYNVDAETGEITLLDDLVSEEDFISADYKVPGETTGPWAVMEERALTEPIPGAILAFGRRVTAGDRLAVVVQRKRSISAMEYGGRWDLTMDVDVIARDPLAQRESSSSTFDGRDRDFVDQHGWGDGRGLRRQCGRLVLQRQFQSPAPDRLEYSRTARDLYPWCRTERRSSSRSYGAEPSSSHASLHRADWWPDGRADRSDPGQHQTDGRLGSESDLRSLVRRQAWVLWQEEHRADASIVGL